MRPPLTEVLRSSAFRIAGLYSILFVASLVALLSMIYWKSTSEFMDDLRKKIKGETAILLTVHRDEGLDGLVRAIKRRAPSDYFYALQDGAGTRLAGDLGTVRMAPGWYQIEAFEDLGDQQVGETTTVQMLGTRLGDGGILAVGASSEGIDDLREIILYASSWVVGLTAVLALLGGLIIYRTSMRRVDLITRSSRDIMTGDLTHRLPLNGSGDELDRLSDSINRMLARIEQLLAGMKQVTSDIAHDLRTPLGRLRQKLELARESGLSEAECRAVFEHAITETDGILETFDALLRIGKIEAGATARPLGEVDLSEMVGRLSESYRPVIEDNAQVLASSIEPGISVTGDRELLTQMLVNLIENAVRHCHSGTQISLGLSHDADAVRLTVADNGCGVPAEELPNILRPFYRLEQSRSSNGSGLGLALVNAIARLHDIRIELGDNGPGLKASLAFPARPPAAPHAKSRH
jgi:signal transduction histidine kinase